MHKWKSYDVWFLTYRVWQAKSFFTLDHFLPFYSTNNPENEHFDKMKKTIRDIIISYMCTINENHMIYVSWNMKHDRQTFLSSWAIFLPFYPTNNLKKLKFWKTEIKTWKYYHFKQEYQKCDHMLYRFWDMAHDGCNFHFLFWAAWVCTFKAPGDITILPMCT